MKREGKKGSFKSKEEDKEELRKVHHIIIPIICFHHPFEITVFFSFIFLLTLNCPVQFFFGLCCRPEVQKGMYNITFTITILFCLKPFFFFLQQIITVNIFTLYANVCQFYRMYSQNFLHSQILEKKL